MANTPWDIEQLYDVKEVAEKLRVSLNTVYRAIDRGVKHGVHNLKRAWDADHIRPVVEGGGACGLDNLRTLCVPCHKSATKELARRRAEQRRLERTGQPWMNFIEATEEGSF